ncbi:hypothetical protein [Thioalkalivibrio sp. XN8]|nr:hypothetical protein [Thioalkalivibrio sp. XN8]
MSNLSNPGLDPAKLRRLLVDLIDKPLDLMEHYVPVAWIKTVPLE